GLVLGEGRAALPAESQQPHHLPVSFLPPRLQLQLPVGVSQRLLVLAPRLVVCGEAAKGVESLAVQGLALEHEPFLKLLAIGQVETLQKIAAIQFGGPTQAGMAGGAVLHLAMAVPPAGSNQP